MGIEENQYPAERLLGVTLSNGWYVKELRKSEPSSGQQYSTCYIVEKDGVKGFLKAFDYRDLAKPGGENLYEKLRQLYMRERDLVKLCNEKNIETVVGFIDSGRHFFKIGDLNELVEYFILEYSDDGNIQECLDEDKLSELALKFKSLGDACDGLHNLHSNGIVHLDVKPSNLVFFIEERLTKITDFGSARKWISDLDENSQHDNDRIVTTRVYAPPEFLYEEPELDWNDYRRKVDLFLLGNVIVKIFTNLSFSALLKTQITVNDDWNDNRNRGQMRRILPSLTAAASNVYVLIKERVVIINEQCNKPLSESEIGQIIGAIIMLCNPNPEFRGHPKELARIGSSDGLDRIRDMFYNLSRKMQYRKRTNYQIEPK